jgi:general stress protein YciG
MGEPLNNYDNVVAACKGLVDCRRWNLRHERVTVSTVGVTPKIRKFTKDMPELALALSLHAPNQEARSAIVPAAKAYPIEGLIDALDNHMMSGFSANEKVSNNSTEQEGKDDIGTVGGYSEEQRKSASKRKRAMIEYVMLEGETSSFECAHQLGKLCENRRLIVNLIPYNQTDVKDKLRCPPREHIEKFQDIVRSYGSFCYIRKTMGADIAGACGQLVVEKEQKDANDIEDIGRNGKQSSDKGGKTNRKVVRKFESSSLDGNVNGVPSVNHSETEGAPGGQFGIPDARDFQEGSQGDSSLAEIEVWIKPLAIATALAAGAFAISTIFILTKRRR